MVGIEALPAAIYLLAIFGIPKSPRWLIFNQKDYIKAEEIQKEMNMIPFTENEIKKIVDSESSFTEKLFSAKYKFPVLLAFLLAFFNQLSGINAFLYYAPRIFEEAGLGESTALLSSVGIGLVNLIFSSPKTSIVEIMPKNIENEIKHLYSKYKQISILKKNKHLFFPCLRPQTWAFSPLNLYFKKILSSSNLVL